MNGGEKNAGRRVSDWDDWGIIYGTEEMRRKLSTVWIDQDIAYRWRHCAAANWLKFWNDRNWPKSGLSAFRMIRLEKPTLRYRAVIRFERRLCAASRPLKSALPPSESRRRKLSDILRPGRPAFGSCRGGNRRSRWCGRRQKAEGAARATSVALVSACYRACIAGSTAHPTTSRKIPSLLPREAQN